MSAAVQELLKILDIEPLEVNLFRGRSPQVGWQRVFGGQVIGQALVAACRTVEGRLAHSMHAYFLLPGDPKVPIIYDVERTRDGKSFSTRLVKAIQHGQPIFTMSVSFHNSEGGLDHQAKMPDVPTPEDLPSESEIRERILPQMPDPVRKYYERERPIELRPVEFERYRGQEIRGWPLQCLDPHHRQVAGRSGDPSMRALLCLRHDACSTPRWCRMAARLFEKDFMAASLDHALWLHRPFRADDWLLYSQDSPNLQGSRGFARGLIFKRDGTLAASVAQEGLIRERRQRERLTARISGGCPQPERSDRRTPPESA